MRQDRGVGRCRHPHHTQDTQATDADLNVRVLQHIAQFVEVLLDGLHQEAAVQKQTQIFPFSEYLSYATLSFTPISLYSVLLLLLFCVFVCVAVCVCVCVCVACARV